MDRINWPEAMRIWSRFNSGELSTESAKILLENTTGLPEMDVESMLSPNTEFGGHLGSFTRAKCFANIETGDLFIVNWIQNVPASLWSWVEISRAAYNIWSRR
jgi:hypothetical protein